MTIEIQANFFRPLSRQVWFGLLTPVADGQALVFHLANFAVFLAAPASDFVTGAAIPCDGGFTIRA